MFSFLFPFSKLVQPLLTLALSKLCILHVQYSIMHYCLSVDFICHHVDTETFSIVTFIRLSGTLVVPGEECSARRNSLCYTFFIEEHCNCSYASWDGTRHVITKGSL